MMIKGKVKFFNKEKRFGFIVREDGEPDVFIGSRSWRHEKEMQALPKDGDILFFEVEDGLKGRKEAKDWMTVTTKKKLDKEEAEKKRQQEEEEYLSVLLSRTQELNKESLQEARKLNDKLKREVFLSLDLVEKSLEEQLSNGELIIGKEISDEELIFPLIDQEAAKRVQKLYPDSIPIGREDVKVSYKSRTNWYGFREYTEPTIHLEVDDVVRLWHKLPEDFLRLPGGCTVSFSVKLRRYRMYKNIKRMKEEIYKEVEKRVLEEERKNLSHINRCPDPMDRFWSFPKVVTSSCLHPADGKRIREYWCVKYITRPFPLADKNGFYWVRVQDKKEAEAIHAKARKKFRQERKRARKEMTRRAKSKLWEYKIQLVERAKENFPWPDDGPGFFLPESPVPCHEMWLAPNLHSRAKDTLTKESYSLEHYSDYGEAVRALAETKRRVEEVIENRKKWELWKQISGLVEELEILLEFKEDFKEVSKKTPTTRRERRHGAGKYHVEYSYPSAFEEIPRMLEEAKKFARKEAPNFTKVTASLQELEDWLEKASSILKEFEGRI